MNFNTKNIQYSDDPFDHWTLENLLDIEDARQVSKEFIDYESTEDIVRKLHKLRRSIREP